MGNDVACTAKDLVMDLLQAVLANGSNADRLLMATDCTGLTAVHLCVAENQDGMCLRTINDPTTNR